MLVNLSDVFTSEGKVTALSVPLEMKSFQSGMGDFRLLAASPVTLRFTNDGAGRARLEGSADLKFECRCDRCLAETPVSLQLEFEDLLFSPGHTGEGEEVPVFMDGFQFDVETFVYEEILMNWPMKILCREDCRGVCPVCGKNLNEGNCGCDTFVPDPRMAAIQEIFRRE